MQTRIRMKVPFTGVGENALTSTMYVPVQSCPDRKMFCGALLSMQVVRTVAASIVFFGLNSDQNVGSKELPCPNTSRHSRSC